MEEAPYNYLHATYLLNLIKCKWNSQFGIYKIIFAESRGAEFNGEYKEDEIIKDTDPGKLKTGTKIKYPDPLNVNDFCWADSYEP